MYSREQLIILDADGTTIDAFNAIGKTFAHHGMDVGDLTRFQKRHRLFKYLGGLKEFPVNLKKQLGKQKCSQIIATLTEVYREEGQLYPGIAELIRTLLALPELRIGLITRNITIEPEETLGCLFLRHGVDVGDLDFLIHVPLAEDKGPHFREVRERFAVNPARAYACGDEHKDFLAAINAGMYPFMVSYGFENHARLTQKFGVPEAIISRTPEALCGRICNTLDLVQPG